MVRRVLPAFFLSAALLAHGQDKPVVPFVDRATAQTLVDTLNKENETLKADTKALRQQLVTLTEKRTTMRKWLDDLIPLLEELKARNADLATLNERVVDRSLKARLLAAADKNKAQEKLLVGRMDELDARLVKLADQLDALTSQVSVNEARAGRNTDSIIILQATITKTQVQADQLQTLVDQVDLLASKVGTALGQTVP